jgi:hypothetical protein
VSAELLSRATRQADKMAITCDKQNAEILTWIAHELTAQILRHLEEQPGRART